MQTRASKGLADIVKAMCAYRLQNADLLFIELPQLRLKLDSIYSFNSVTTEEMSKIHDFSRGMFVIRN